jgi:hypothetical protein
VPRPVDEILFLQWTAPHGVEFHPNYAPTRDTVPRVLGRGSELARPPVWQKLAKNDYDWV